MKKLILALLAILLMFIASPSAYAKDEDHNPKDKDNDFNRFELKSKSNTQEFEIMGEITTIVGNNFVVSGQTIFIDPSQVKEFEQKGILEVGKKVKVEGIIKNGVKFAQDINVIGTGQGRFKFEKVKANGPAQEVENFLKQILALMKSFVS